MLESYLKAASEVQNLLLQNGKINKLSTIDNESVKELVDFLGPFEECTKVFSQDSQPTLYQIAPWFHKLHQHLEINEDDSDELKLLKGQAMICFAEYCKTSTMHYVAALLNPKFRKLKFASEEKKAEARKEMKQLIMGEIEKERDQAGKDAGHSEKPRPTDPGPEAKKSRFADIEDSDTEENSTEIGLASSSDLAIAEMNKYLDAKLTELNIDSFLISEISDKEKESQVHFDILGFWCGATKFPHLQKIAQRLLAIPASQSTDERVFPSTWATSTPRRTLLSAGTLSELTFIHKNY
ncbi:uncharacterized protein LOC110855781 [Folsomia candida]|uniref:uncharacterized protein LOC110855781 n=1 Tax=Folsomia candida TaxID=158441 RepID=UPI0016054EE2|nr:uncharacterized protein LOC110855781 [Folsomia candida]